MNNKIQSIPVGEAAISGNFGTVLHELGASFKVNSREFSSFFRNATPMLKSKKCVQQPIDVARPTSMLNEQALKNLLKDIN